MAKRKYCFDDAGIEKLQSGGHGQGSGINYIPWIRAHDINSIGLTTRAPGWKSGRIHHFFSKLEAHYFYCLEWADCVLDVREQFPLDHHATYKIAEDAGINYPWDRKTGFNAVLTTDFLIDVRVQISDARYLSPLLLTSPVLVTREACKDRVSLLLWALVKGTGHWKAPLLSGLKGKLKPLIVEKIRHPKRLHEKTPDEACKVWVEKLQKILRSRLKSHATTAVAAHGSKKTLLFVK